MKKVLALTAIASLALSAFGQGVVQMNNLTPARANIYDSDGTTALSGSGFRAALLGGATGASAWAVSTSGITQGSGLSLLASPTTGATYMTFRTGAGAGVLATGTDAARTVPTVNWGGQAVVQLVAWSGTYNTWADAVAAAIANPTSVRLGASNALTVTLPSGPTDPVLTYLPGLQSFSIVTVPEPSILALLGLGAASLLIFRRRS